MAIIVEWFGSLASLFWAYLLRVAIQFTEFLAIATVSLIRQVRRELVKLNQPV